MFVVFFLECNVLDCVNDIQSYTIGAAIIDISFTNSWVVYMCECMYKGMQA